MPVFAVKSTFVDTDLLNFAINIVNKKNILVNISIYNKTQPIPTQFLEILQQFSCFLFFFFLTFIIFFNRSLILMHLSRTDYGIESIKNRGILILFKLLVLLITLW